VVGEEVQAEQGPAQQDGLAAVGVKLAHAREQQQLKLESVASDLHLRPEVVRALERGDEAQLPSQPFVRGYIKSYARVLGLDEAALLAQLPRVGEHTPVPLKRVGMRQRKTVSLAGGKFLVWGLLLGSLIVVTGYGVPALQRLWSARTAEPVADQLLIPLPGYGDDAAQQPEPPETEEPEAQTEIPLEAPAGEPVAVEELVEGDVAALAGTEIEPPAEAQPASEETAGPAVVQLRFVEDSWVEMEANGRKLVVGTQRAGTERTVRVEPPVYLLLGNAPGVEVIFRGKPVDVGSHQRGKVARLTLED
jgi:cytoskeleton protein RodZ